MSWSGEFCVSWDPGYSPLGREVLPLRDVLQLTSDRKLKHCGDTDFLDCLSLEPGTCAFGFSQGFWIASDPGQIISPSELSERQSCDSPMSSWLHRHRFLVKISFSGVTGEVKYTVYEGSAIVETQFLTESGTCGAPGNWKMLFKLPFVIAPHFSPNAGVNFPDTPSAGVAVDELSMEMLSSLVGVDLLRADDRDIPVLGLFRKIKGVTGRNGTVVVVSYFMCSVYAIRL